MEDLKSMIREMKFAIVNEIKAEVTCIKKTQENVLIHMSRTDSKVAHGERASLAGG